MTALAVAKNSRSLSLDEDSSALKALPFVRERRLKEVAASKNKFGRDFWTVRKTGDWAADVHIGEDLADALFAYVVRFRGAWLLPWVVSDIVNKGDWSGVECGFFNRIGLHLLAASGR